MFLLSEWCREKYQPENFESTRRRARQESDVTESAVEDENVWPAIGMICILCGWPPMHPEAMVSVPRLRAGRDTRPGAALRDIKDNPCPPSTTHRETAITAFAMAGGSAINVFKFNTGGLPKETLNFKLWFAVFAFGLLGAARGVDEGLITGVFNSHAFKQSLGIDGLDEAALASVKGTVSSMVQLGSVAGALL